MHNTTKIEMKNISTRKDDKLLLNFENKINEGYASDEYHILINERTKKY